MTDEPSKPGMVIIVADKELAEERKKLREALEAISKFGYSWDANKMGGVSIQRKRWQKMAEIAREALK